jgi:urease accessory protein
MMVIESVLDPDIPIPDHLEKDVVVLDWEGRRKPRQRAKTRKGLEIAIAMPTGTVLKDGDILFVGDSYHIVVEAREEDVIVIYPQSIHESARVGFELGNRHLPVSIRSDVISTPYSHDTEGVLMTLQVSYQRKTEIFEPERLTGHHVHS